MFRASSAYRRLHRRWGIINNHQRDRGIATGKRSQKQTIVLRLRSRPVERAVRIEAPAREIPVRGEKEGALAAYAALDRVTEAAGHALAEEQVLLRQMEEDEFQELGETHYLVGGRVFHAVGAVDHVTHPKMGSEAQRSQSIRIAGGDLSHIG